MFEKVDGLHIKAMEEMKARMQSPKTFTEWYDRKKKEFNALPNNLSFV